MHYDSAKHYLLPNNKGLQSLDLQIFTTISGEAGSGAQHEYSKQYHTQHTAAALVLSARCVHDLCAGFTLI